MDVEGENLLVLEAVFEQFVYTRNIDLLFDLQLVMVREVEGHRHVGLPHAALHVEHGQGVGGAFGEGEGVAVLTKNCAHLLEFDFFAVEVDRFVNICGVSRTACFVGADIGGYGVFLSIIPKFQQAGRFTVRAADIQKKNLMGTLSSGLSPT